MIYPTLYIEPNQCTLLCGDEIWLEKGKEHIPLKPTQVLKDTNYVESVIAIGDLQKLKKDKKKQQFYLEPFIKDTVTSDLELISIKKELFEKYPFYDEFLFNTKTKSVRSAIHLKKSIVK